MIRFIVFGTYSERDRMGNTYSFARVTSTKTGRSVIVDYAPNVVHMLRKAGLEWAELYQAERVVGKRDFRAMQKTGDAYGVAYLNTITAADLDGLERDA